MANIIAFFIFHGDAEYAMKTFSLQAGLMLACRRNLLARLREEDANEPLEAGHEEALPELDTARRLSPV
jgi:hypothetical protein